jgi:DNA-directed RNA polymerase specialized sigma24 family protein
MCDCSSLLSAIKQGDEIPLEKALLDITKGKDGCGFKKIAAYVFNRYCYKSRQDHTWEDLLYDGLLKFVRAVKGGTEVKSCGSFFFQICKRTCWEWDSKAREEGETPTEPPSSGDYARGWMDDLAVLVKMKPGGDLAVAASACLGQMNDKSQLLLQARYFEEPQLKDPQQLAELLSGAGYNVNPKNIPQELANCLAPYKLCLQKHLKPN